MNANVTFGEKVAIVPEDSLDHYLCSQRLNADYIFERLIPYLRPTSFSASLYRYFLYGG